MIDNKTTHYNLPKPNLANYQEEDVPRISQAIDMIDEVLGEPASETNRGLIQTATPAEAQTGTNTLKAIVPATATVLIKDSLRAAVEAASGGDVTILYDDMGNPSYMRRFVPMLIKNLYRQYYASDAAWNESAFKVIENEVHPAFLKNGTRVKELLVGQYQACSVNNLACSLPYRVLWTNRTYDTALAACKNKGPNWTMSTMYIWGFLQALCLRQGYQPRGNTSYGRSDKVPWEHAITTEGFAPGDFWWSTLAGTGPVAWTHDGTESGVADLVGNVFEWQTLMKLVDGKIILPPDNDIDLPEADWPDTGARYDSTGGTEDGTGIEETTGDIGDPKVSDEITKYVGLPGSDADYKEMGSGFATMTKKTGYTPPVSLILAGLAPITHYDGSYKSNNALNGSTEMRNYGTRLPRVGGAWRSGSNAGLGALNLDSTRLHGDSRYFGFRPVFLLV
jgi:hypothetical protein